MDIHKTIKILEALASGCSPTTGEVISSDSVLNVRDVIRALETALFHLNSKSSSVSKEVLIEDRIIEKVIQLFKEQGGRIGSNNLVEFFLGTRSFKNLHLISSEFYGRYKDVYSKGELADFFTKYLSEQNKLYNKYTTDKSFKNSDFLTGKSLEILQTAILNVSNKKSMISVFLKQKTFRNQFCAQGKPTQEHTNIGQIMS